MEMVRQSVNSVSAYSTMLMDAEPRSRSTLAVAIGSRGRGARHAAPPATSTYGGSIGTAARP